MNRPAVRRPLPRKTLATLVGATILIAWAWWQIDFRPGALLSAAGMQALIDQAIRLSSPLLRADVLLRIGDAALTTLALATASSAMAAVIALLLMPLACESLLVRGPLIDGTRRSRIRQAVAVTVHHGVRLTANLLRTVPYVVWALLLVLLLGLGPMPAVIALGLHTAGVLTRLFAGALDTLEPAPLLAMRATGASRLGILLFAVLPQVRAQLLAYWLYRWEINLREATVLGMVAAGGLGYEIAMAFGQFKYQTLATTLLAVIILVLAGEALSGWLRKRLV